MTSTAANLHRRRSSQFESENGEVTAMFFRGSQFGGTEGFDSVVDAIVNGQEVDEGLVEEIENTEDVNVFAMGIEDPEVRRGRAL